MFPPPFSGWIPPMTSFFWGLSLVELGVSIGVAADFNASLP